MTGIGLGIGLAAAAAPGQHAAQAEQFLANGWTADAIAEVEEGLREPGGIDDLALVLAAARAHAEWLSMGRAVELYARAAALDPQRAEAWTDAARALAETYGEVAISGPRARTPLRVEAVDPVFDPVARARAEAYAARVRAGVDLPATAWLPAGRWRVNGSEVAAEPGRRSELRLAGRHLGAAAVAPGEPDDAARARVGAGLGVSILGGARVNHQAAAPAVELELALPLGAAWIGAALQWEPRAHAEGGAEVLRADAGGMALRAGLALPVGGALALRPALGAAYARVPGVAFDCAASGSSYACGDVDSPVLRAFVPGDAVGPAAELAVDYRDAAQALPSLGLRATAVALAGWVDAGGTLGAEDAALGPPSAGYEVDDPSWSAWLVRVQLTVGVPLR